jgi:hypothetical protein
MSTSAMASCDEPDCRRFRAEDVQHECVRCVSALERRVVQLGGHAERAFVAAARRYDARARLDALRGRVEQLEAGAPRVTLDSATPAR